VAAARAQRKRGRGTTGQVVTLESPPASEVSTTTRISARRNLIGVYPLAKAALAASTAMAVKRMLR
jgi:hypothetical protein